MAILSATQEQITEGDRNEYNTSPHEQEVFKENICVGKRIVSRSLEQWTHTSLWHESSPTFLRAASDAAH